MEAVIILVTTFVSTVLSSMSGGGTSIINLPVFLALGLSFPVVAAIQKASSAFWVIPAAYNYLKGRKIDWKFLILFSLIGLIGVYLGVLIVVSVAQRYLEILIGFMIVCLVIYMYFQKSLGLKEEGKQFSIYRKMLAYPAAVLLGAYEGIFGAGNAILFAVLTFFTRGFDFIDAAGHYYAVVLPWLILATLLFAQRGYFDIALTIPAVVGATLGGYVGSKYAKYKGNKFIKTMFMAVGGILGLKLIVGI